MTGGGLISKLLSIGSNEAWLRASFRLVGYLLLATALLDILVVFAPPHFTDPVWEFQMMGALVDRVPVPILGLGFVFFGCLSTEQTRVEQMSRASHPVLVALSWLCLVVGVLFLALLPLGLNATWRINTANNRQISSQEVKQLAQIQQRKEQLNQATAKNLDDAFALLNRRGFKGVNSGQQLKERLFSDVAALEKQIKENAEKDRTQLRLNLLRDAFRWNLGALFAGLVYIFLWRITFQRNQLALKPVPRL
ncbi:HpsJ-like protein, cyanoexosortase A-associated [Anthocerotibacter panamensis]|uniref:HpsJ-like protein, cyanoexosortase A-associated n=1 Tax=Anthocerotibacter panamensis TaxID=2857077 RepID=UPI001FDA1932|nr:HpsJ family protein [Anthocerotibacter panamensis]